jgi:hypothetical protein
MQEFSDDLPKYPEPTITEVEAQVDDLLAKGAMLQAEIDAGWERRK